ncbi:hypothetical protein [Mammaliicoccus vitulinus]|uniref:hypothetical protein n=1 Tax=Mammaliicoccus vitulinus TaxID=71237 RepID=UPI00248D03F2|nr:hypothetical protein [Mammaliicoccus vitulinus]
MYYGSIGVAKVIGPSLWHTENIAIERTESVLKGRGKNLNMNKDEEQKIKEEEKEALERAEEKIADEATGSDAEESIAEKDDVEGSKAVDNEASEEEATAESGDTLTPSQGADQGESGKKAEKMLTQSQVNELVGRARQEGRESALREILEKYGVGSDEELNELFGKGQTYDDLDNDYQNQSKSYREAMAENALLKSGIDENRWQDVMLILGGKGLEVTPENIGKELETHPEWQKANNIAGNDGLKNAVLTETARNNTTSLEEKPSRLTKLGNEPSGDPKMTEEEIARALFGI